MQKFSVNTNFTPTISLCFKAPATLHNLRQFMEYRASKCWTLIGWVGVIMFLFIFKLLTHVCWNNSVLSVFSPTFEWNWTRCQAISGPRVLISIMISASIKNNAHSVALFTVTFSRLHYNIFERECEAISGKKCKIARNSLTSTFKDIVMQMKKVTVKGAVAMARIQQLYYTPKYYTS